MSHTPGPWRVGKNYGAVVADHPIENGIGGSDDIEGYGGYLIAESISKCNNAIIAAAPELLEACEKVFAEAEERNAEEGMALSLSEKFEHLSPGFKALVAAIKKARGLES